MVVWGVRKSYQYYHALIDLRLSISALSCLDAESSAELDDTPCWHVIWSYVAVISIERKRRNVPGSDRIRWKNRMEVWINPYLPVGIVFNALFDVSERSLTD